MSNTYLNIGNISSDFLIEVAQGKRPNYRLVSIDGFNPSVDNTTVPEDLWWTGGVYPGFPSGAAEQFQLVAVNGGDVGGTITFDYMEDLDSDWQTTSFTLTSTLMSTGITGVRLRNMKFTNAGASALGSITARHITTTANVFAYIHPAYNSSVDGNYTIPKGYKGYLISHSVGISRTTSTVTVDGVIFTKKHGGSQNYIAPFNCSMMSQYNKYFNGALVFDEKTDLITRVVQGTTTITRTCSNITLLLAKI